MDSGNLLIMSWLSKGIVALTRALTNRGITLLYPSKKGNTTNCRHIFFPYSLYLIQNSMTCAIKKYMPASLFRIYNTVFNTIL